jgi:hypothetical protein
VDVVAIVAALIGVGIDIAIIVWWIMWGGQMRALAERQANLMFQTQEILRDLRNESRTLTKHLTE